MADEQYWKSQHPDHAEHQALLQRLDRYADLMDSRFRVPGTQLRFGLDGLVGLVPVVGDLVAVGLSLYPLAEARRIKAPSPVLRRMGMNIGLDFLVGMVPIAGDALDFAFKANKRNVELLRSYTQAHLVPKEPTRKPELGGWLLAGMGVLIAAALTFSYW